jgi:uncharacterized protein
MSTAASPGAGTDAAAGAVAGAVAGAGTGAGTGAVTGAAAGPPAIAARSSVAAMARLEAVLLELRSVVVAFSGGADSAFLASVAHRTLGSDAALCVTAASPSLPAADLAHCRSLADEWQLNWRVVETSEMDDPLYVANGPDRCARCKGALMAVLGPIAAAAGATVVLGVNTDDLGDYRPGQAAAAASGARFPLVEAGLSKSDVRALSRDLGLRTWDRPAGACLASRLPYGTPVTVQRLRAVDAAESALRALGLRTLRVRDHGAVARIEVANTELGVVWTRREEVVAAVRAAGYDFVTLDLEGFRSGSMNRMLRRSVRA